MLHDNPTPRLIRVFRSARLVLHLAWIGIGAAALYPAVGEKRRIRLKQRWSRQILEILSIRLDAKPFDAPPGSLIVANHVSWLDIFVINALRPAAFISKTEVRQWPFIGWLAERNGTVFLRRGSRGHARIVNAEIDALLNSGKDVAIFPEGTTTDGTHLLGFHAALLQPAVESQRPLLPLALSYHNPYHEDLGIPGTISVAPSFAGDTTLKQCFAAILACRSLTVWVTQAPLIESAGKSRRELSQAAHAAIAAKLSIRSGFRPSSSPPEKIARSSSRIAVSEPPHRQPESIANRLGKTFRPKADQ